MNALLSSTKHSYKSLSSSIQLIISLFIFILILGMSMNIYAATNTANCNIDTLSTDLSIPINDPDAAAVTGITLTSATMVTNIPTLGEYCEVAGNIKTIEATQIPLNPGDNVSTIGFAVKLPTLWNERFILYNGGGLDGSITASIFPGFGWTATAANSPLSGTYSSSGGYAIAATDSGRVSGVRIINADGTQNTAMWVNYGYRSRHLLAVIAKQVINNYYGKNPVLSFMGGLSTGGRSALIAAARYPYDFDAVLAFAPSWFNTNRFQTFHVRYSQAQFPATCTLATVGICLASQVIPTAGPNNVMPLIDTATMNTCDAKDGLKDGILSDPANCEFDPMTDPNLPTCIGPQGPACLTVAQKQVLKTLWSDTITPGAGVLLPNSGVDVVYPRFVPGYENTAGSDKIGRQFGGTPPVTFSTLAFHSAIRDFVYNNPTIMLANINLSTNAFDLLNWTACPGPCSLMNPQAVETNTDLSAFKAAGGKLLIIHGLADAEDTPVLTVDYFNDVASKTGGLDSARDFMRLFLVPGRGHGTGTTTAVSGAPANVGLSAGANTGWLKALEDWVATGVAPDSLLGTNTFTSPALPTITRPICAYPFKAVYTGPGGDTAAMKIASNFQCRFYDLKGLFSPVGNFPALNEVKAGQSIPVKFSLGGNWGLNIMASGYPKSEVIACGATVSVNGVDETVTTGGDGLQYDPSSDQYTYVWKTNKSWKDSCRQLVIRLNEGTTVRANFAFN